MSEERRLEIKVGVLLVAALLSIVGLLFLMGGFEFDRVRVEADLSHAGGVSKGSPVKMAGVRIGRISSLALVPGRVDEAGLPLSVHMAFEIDHAAAAVLRTDARIDLATQGPLGEPYLELFPGTPEAPPLPPGTALRAHPPRLDLLMPKLVVLIDTAQALLGEVEASSLKTLLDELRGVALWMRHFLEANGETLSKTVQSLARVSDRLETLALRGNALLAPKGDLRRSVADLAALSDELRVALPRVAGKTEATLDDLTRLTGSITPEDLAALKNTLGEAEKAGRQLNAFIAQADRLLAEIDSGQGTLGALAKDKALYEDLRALITDLKQHPWKLLWKD